MKEQLIELGLDPREAEIYLHLLKEQKSKATAISKETGINRTVVYSILEKLIQKGLVSYILINGKRHFSASSPKALIDLLNDKQRIANSLLPSLERISKDEKEPVTVEVFQGIQGGLTVLKDILREGKDYVSIGDEGTFQNILEGTIAQRYAKQLEERKIKERLLTREGIKLLKSKHTQVRHLSKEFKFSGITTIYGNKIAISIFDKPYYVLLIKSKTLAADYASLFEFLWKIAKR